MSLHGTKTHENLKEAFAGESQANRRYLWFAQKADVEGYPDTAMLFRSVARYSRWPCAWPVSPSATGVSFQRLAVGQ